MRIQTNIFENASGNSEKLQLNVDLVLDEDTLIINSNATAMHYKSACILLHAKE